MGDARLSPTIVVHSPGVLGPPSVRLSLSWSTPLASETEARGAVPDTIRSGRYQLMVGLWKKLAFILTAWSEESPRIRWRIDRGSKRVGRSRPAAGTEVRGSDTREAILPGIREAGTVDSRQIRDSTFTASPEDKRNDIRPRSIPS